MRSVEEVEVGDIVLVQRVLDRVDRLAFMWMPVVYNFYNGTIIVGNDIWKTWGIDAWDSPYEMFQQTLEFLYNRLFAVKTELDEQQVLLNFRTPTEALAANIRRLLVVYGHSIEGIKETTNRLYDIWLQHDWIDISMNRKVSDDEQRDRSGAGL